ncbi:mechanosensitive ion channel family protein [Alkalibacterium sp. MB6]|uniref:mechanosensitive ion channel family protein n=1 Tax=Alkalibacterium sp. MB6 TaxID=2081965 RepID=UPI00137B5C5E|nr:mechanosensitive ion channel family protein [Alkalibacterium sp. MB6]
MEDQTDVLQTIQEETNFITELWNSIPWRSIGVTVIVEGLKILVAVIVFLIVKKIVEVVIEAIFNRYMKNNNRIPNRLNTLFKLSKNILNAVLYFILISTILTIIGIEIGPLIAGAGVVGLSLSLGAQGFVSDVVNGFMILMEKQADVGDVVKIGDVTGTVEDVNLKTTKLRDFDGTIHYIPNRVIEIISNMSRADMRVLIQIRLFPTTDFEEVRKVLEQVNDELFPMFEEEITVKPTGISFVPVGSGQMAAEIIMFAKNGTQWAVRNTFYEEYVEALREKGIELPKINFDLAE